MKVLRLNEIGTQRVHDLDIWVELGDKIVNIYKAKEGKGFEPDKSLLTIHRRDLRTQDLDSLFGMIQREEPAYAREAETGLKKAIWFSIDSLKHPTDPHYSGKNKVFHVSGEDIKSVDIAIRGEDGKVLSSSNDEKAARTVESTRIREALETSDKICIITYGTFNPPDNSNTRVLKKVTLTADSYGADHVVFVAPLSTEIENSEHLLTWEETLKFLIAMYPAVNFCGEPDIVNVAQAAEWIYGRNYDTLVVVAPSRDVASIETGLSSINDAGEMFDFEKILVVATGDPTIDNPDSSTAATVQNAILDENFADFSSAMDPEVAPALIARLYRVLRSKADVE